MSSLDQSEVDRLLNEIQGSVETPAADSAAAAAVMTAPAVEPAAFDEPGPASADAALAGEFDPPPTSAPRRESMTDTAPEFQRLLVIEVPVIVLLGQRRMNVGEVMRLAVGAIVEFSKSADEELDLLINNKPIGKGTAVKVGENFGIKITNIGSVRDVIMKLGGR
jgi:flagellar motor switch protein FliN/FliY